MNDASNLSQLLERLAAEIDRVYDRVRDLPVTPAVTVPELRRRVEQAFDFERERTTIDVFDEAVGLLRDYSLQVTHPRYFGLFNPAVLPSTIIADAIVALYNTQAGGWSHGPAANEMERVVLQHLAAALGFAPGTTSAHFTSGGNEANHTAVIAALAHTFPEWSERGVRAIEGTPVVYVSSESHHSFLKVLRAAGLGTDALRAIPADDRFRLQAAPVAAAIERDLGLGHRPMMVVATAGTTGAGAIDPIEDLAQVARRFGLWFHVDAAWGGAAALIPRLRPLLRGVEQADSVTWDAHKWLNVPLGAGMFFTRHESALARAFGVDTGYIPPTEAGAVDLYKYSMQWSRRFIGLKLLFVLAEHGREGLATLLDGQARMGDRLRAQLQATGWTVTNDTPLPLVCFTHADIGRDRAATSAFVSKVLARGRVWVSEVNLPGQGWVLRACITSFRVNAGDLDVLVSELEVVRKGT
ncbi:MAG: aminotransferase class V-fold PLP-dependent enzyme [Gemmatimonadaceae bacterium]